MDIIGTLEALKTLKIDTPSEADTRALYLDPILAALGWTGAAIKREPYAGWTDARGFIDYLLLVRGKSTLVIEAKKVGRTFELPAALRRQATTSYKKLRAVAGADLLEALEQCLRYTQHTGAQYACATNGSEWIFFKPNQPYRSLPDARVILFSSLDDILKNLDNFESLLSLGGVESGNAEKLLVGREILVPYFAKRLRDAFPYRRELSLEEEEYSKILDQLLTQYVVDITEDEAFYDCYVPVRTNRRTLSSLGSVIDSQVSALSSTPSSETATTSGFTSSVVAQSVLPGMVAGRTIVLHGAIGVGKTSFLRSCRLELTKTKTLKSAAWVQIDLLDFRDRPFDQSSVTQMLNLLSRRIQDQVSESTQQLDGKYDPDTWAHLRDIYNKEVRKFQKLKYPDSTDQDPQYLTAVRDYVWELRERDPHEHLIRVIHWLTVNCKLPVVIVLDNSDQLGIEFQEFLYKLSETFQKKTSAVTILVLRTEALASHRIREHSLASVMEQYQVQRAQLPLVLEKRFTVMETRLRKIVGDTLTPQQLVAIERISVLMDTLQTEAELGSQAYQLLDAIGNDSLRDSLRAVAAVFRASPRQMDKLVADQARSRDVRLYADTVLKALFRHDMSSHDPRPLVPIVFRGDTSVRIPYSLPIRVMQQIKSKTTLAEYSVSECLNEFAVAGCDRDLLIRILNMLRSDKLVIVPHMLQDLREQDALATTKLGDFVVTSATRYELYYEQIVFDVVIYDYEAYAELRSIWNSDLETYQKFHNMGYLLRKLIYVDDEDLRRTLTLSLLEPTIGVPLSLPGFQRATLSDYVTSEHAEVPEAKRESQMVLPPDESGDNQDDSKPADLKTAKRKGRPGRGRQARPRGRPTKSRRARQDRDIRAHRRECHRR
jgi:hypothetical protein